MALQYSPLLLFLVMVIDWIPGLSQVKSLCQDFAGDREGAIRTQQNFTRQCPGISQLCSGVQLITGNPEAAMETQKAFVRNVVDITDVVPVVSGVKLAAQVFFGDKEAARRTSDNLLRRFPVVSQLRSAGEVMCGDGKAAVATQLEFIRNLGIPCFWIKNFYHYTSKRGAKAIAKDRMIIASGIQAGDASFGAGVYFTSLDPRHFSSREVRINNYNSENLTDKTDYVVEVWISRNEIHQCRDQKKRDIYLYKGNIDLDEYSYRIFITQAF